MNEKLQALILKCANDDQCLVAHVIMEIAQEFDLSQDSATDMFETAKWFIIENENILLEMSEVLYGDSSELNKEEFFRTITREKLQDLVESPFYYLSYQS